MVAAPSDFDELMDKKARGLLETFATTVKTSIPNPVINAFTVTIKDLVNGAKIMEVAITDKFGKVLKQLKYNGKDNVASIDFGPYSPDVYVIRVFDGKIWYSTKFIKQ